MKSCDEMVNSLLERRDEYNVEQKRKKKNLIRITVSMCCVCLVALMGFGFWNGDLLEKKPPLSAKETSQNVTNPAIYHEDQTTATAVPPTLGESTTNDDTEHNVTNPAIYQEDQTTVAAVPPTSGDSTTNDDTEGKKLFAINEITSTVSGCPMDLSKYDKVVFSLEEAAEYFGVNIPQSADGIADELGLRYNGIDEFAVYYDDGTIVEDIDTYGFFGNDGASLYIAVSRLREPYGCMFYSSTNQPTVIRIPETGETVSLRVYGHKNSSGEEYDSYTIDFEHGGNFYRIQADNVLPIYLDSLVRSIVMQTKTPSIALVEGHTQHTDSN